MTKPPMFCRKCYADLSMADQGACRKCGRLFDPANPRTYLPRPFPSTGQIVGYLIATTMVAIAVAGVVSFHQLASTSGH